MLLAIVLDDCMKSNRFRVISVLKIIGPAANGHDHTLNQMYNQHCASFEYLF